MLRGDEMYAAYCRQPGQPSRLFSGVPAQGPRALPVRGGPSEPRSPFSAVPFLRSAHRGRDSRRFALGGRKQEAGLAKVPPLG